MDDIPQECLECKKILSRKCKHCKYKIYIYRNFLIKKGRQMGLTYRELEEIFIINKSQIHDIIYESTDR